VGIEPAVALAQKYVTVLSICWDL